MTDILALPDRDFRKWLTQRLIVDKSLEPNDELYEPLYDDVPDNPVDLIYEDIDLSEVESLNFLSGFRGSGKTTELFRLRKRLRDHGYFVAYANAMEYLLPSEPVGISDFLLVLAGSFGEAVERELKIDLAGEGFWTRFVHFLTKTNVKIDGMDTKATMPRTDVGLNFKTLLKEVPSFRHQVREKLSSRFGELKKEVQLFFDFGREKIKQANKGERVVFLFDQLEQLRDPLGSEARVTESVKTLMANHRRDLGISLFHMVFTVPPWLKFVLPEMTKIRLQYNVKLWKNDDARTPESAGWGIMQRVIERRFTPEGMTRFFGKNKKKEANPHVEKLIHASGGHFRDLLFLLRECVTRATGNLPVSAATVDAAISMLRTSYLPVPLDDAKWLHQIGEQRECVLKNRDPDSVQRMTFFLDTHLAVTLKNGEEWYDIHPLLRDEIAEIVARQAKGS